MKKIGADDFIKMYGVDELKSRIEQSKNHLLCYRAIEFTNLSCLTKSAKDILREIVLFDEQIRLDNFLKQLSKDHSCRVGVLRNELNALKREWFAQFPRKERKQSEREILFDPFRENSEDLINKIVDKIKSNASFYVDHSKRNLIFVADNGAFFDYIGRGNELGRYLDLHFPLKYISEKNVGGEIQTTYMARTYDEKILNSLIANLYVLSKEIMTFRFLSNGPIFVNNELFIKSGFHDDLGIYISSHDIEPVAGLDNINKLLSGFPFKNNASKTNMIAAMLTSAFFLRHFIGLHPVDIITGNSPDLGKSKLAKLIYGCSENAPVSSMSYSHDDNEFEKRIITKVKKSNAVLVDNIKPIQGMEISSACLERMLTDEVISSRQLGKNVDLERENTVQFILTLNEGRFSEDLITRSLPIELCCENKDISKHDFEPVSWFRKNRSLIIGELLGMVNKYIEQRLPESQVTHSKFPNWAKVIGGVLEANNIEGFLDNFANFTAERDQQLSKILDCICSLFVKEKSRKVGPLKSSEIAKSEKLQSFSSSFSNSKLSPQGVGSKLSKLDGKTFEHMYGEVEYKILVEKVRLNSGGNNYGYSFSLMNNVNVVGIPSN